MLGKTVYEVALAGFLALGYSWCVLGVPVSVAETGGSAEEIFDDGWQNGKMVCGDVTLIDKFG